MADIAESNKMLSSANSLNPSNPTSSGQHVLMNDKTKIKSAIRYTTVVVNSRDRNYLNYPNSNHFRYILRRPLTNVHSIELMNGSIPALIYNMNTPWNSFSFKEGNTISTVTLTPGFYTDADICLELQTQLNLISGRRNTYQVTLNGITKKIQIKALGVVPYSFLFYSGKFKDEIDLTTLAILSINTPARLLGFGLTDYTGDTSGIVNAPLPVDLQNFLTRIYLHLESDGRNLSRMELGAGRPDCFHIFYLNPAARVQGYLLLNKDTDHSCFTSSPAPISRVANLEITFRDEFNRIVDLQHREATLVFEICHLE